MSRWKIAAALDCGLAVLAEPPVSVELEAEGPRLQLDAAPEAGLGDESSGVFERLLGAVAAQSFSVSGNSGAVNPLPAPWCALHADGALPSDRTLLAAELALELWLVPAAVINDLGQVRLLLEARGDSLASDVAEGLAYWLLGSTHPIGGRRDIKTYWRSDVDEVLVRRTPRWERTRLPTEPLLACAQRLLEQVIDLRAEAATIADYEALLSRLEQQFSPVPLAFAQAVWWEAGYQLAARGLHSEAALATSRYREACESLAKRLPGLDAADIPGFGVSVGQRAYYDGEFDIALEAYGKESASGSEAHQCRLKRLIANALTDLGALDAAGRLAAEALREQEIAGDPETFKTRGRCAEIALRSGQLGRARELFEQSLEEQRALLGSGSVSGQTLTYLGHVALLGGDPGRAAERYAEAVEADRRRDSRLNAYTLMGQAALALRAGQHAEVLNCLERLESAPAGGINGDILPRAVIAVAAVLAGADREKGTTAIGKLLDNNYAIEALALLPAVYPQTGMASKALNRIDDLLRKWSTALANRAAAYLADDAKGALHPDSLRSALEDVKKRADWGAVKKVGTCVYPVNLIVLPGV